MVVVANVGRLGGAESFESVNQNYPTADVRKVRIEK